MKSTPCELLRTKTDKLDAALIARFCLAMKPDPWSPPSPELRSWRALVRRADSMIDMRSQEKNRLGTAHESVIQLIREHIESLDEEIEKVKRQIVEHIDQDPTLKQKKELRVAIFPMVQGLWA